MDSPQRRALERKRPLQAGHVQSMPDVLRAFGFTERLEVVAGDDPLGQLLQLGALQHGAQLGLTDQDDLQQLALGGFQVRQ